MIVPRDGIKAEKFHCKCIHHVSILVILPRLGTGFPEVLLPKLHQIPGRSVGLGMVKVCSALLQFIRASNNSGAVLDSADKEPKLLLQYGPEYT
jgi:hypothetical protein